MHVQPPAPTTAEYRAGRQPSVLQLKLIASRPVLEDKVIDPPSSTGLSHTRGVARSDRRAFDQEWQPVASLRSLVTLSSLAAMSVLSPHR
jgi:hypothetical protein